MSKPASNRRRSALRVVEGAEEIESAAHRAAGVRYALRLYVAGANRRSSRAIRSITAICEEHLKGRYELQVIDIYQQPTLAKGEQIVAVPTLVKKLPLPLRRFIGTLADKEKIILGLDIRPRK